MKSPFVSRALYERALEDLRRSEEERKSLLDRLLAVSEVAPLQALAEILPDPKSSEAENLIDKTTGALTISGLRQMAQDAAWKRSGRLA